MKEFAVIVKAVVLICAGAVAVTRLVWYRYYTVFSGQTLTVLNAVSFICLGVLILFALIWVWLEKKKQ